MRLFAHNPARGRNRSPLLLLACCAAGLLCSAAEPPWWQAEWEGRVSLRLPASPVATPLPVVVPGKALRGAGVPDRIPVASFRVIGPHGEIPCQVDERDGTLELQPHGNHRLDDDDELVFLAPFSDAAPVECFVYFSRHPRPPGQYRTSLRYGRPSAAFNAAPVHGMFYDRDFKLAVKGPKLPDPTARSVHNYCSGAISALRWRGHDYVRPTSSWTWFVPGHPFGACAAAVTWSLPELVVDGPVRKVVRMESSDLPEPVESVRHTFAVYAGCGVVDFEETVLYREDQEKIALRFGFPLGLAPGFVTAGGTRAGPVLRELTAAELAAQAKPGNVGVHDSSKLDGAEPWWAWVSPTARVGLALFFGKRPGADVPLLGAAHWSSHAYIRRNVSHTAVNLKFAQCRSVRHAMRISCVDGFDGIPFRFRTWSAAPETWIRFGKVETRDGKESGKAGESPE